MYNMIWISLAVILVGVIGYNVAYFKGKKVFTEQMGIWKSGIPLGLENINELYQILTAVRYPVMNNVYIDNDFRIIAEGRKYKHEFCIEDGVIKIGYPYNTKNMYGGLFRSLKQMSIHKNIAAMVEGNQIMDAIAAGQQVSSGQQQKGYEGSSAGLKILRTSFAAIIIGGILLCVGITQGMSAEYVQYAKDKCPYENKDATYGEIFDFYLAEPEWNYFESDQNKYIVEVSGVSSVDDNVQILAQFVFVGVSSSSSITSHTPINITYMEVNGQTCTADEAVEIIEYIVLEYISQ